MVRSKGISELKMNKEQKEKRNKKRNKQTNKLAGTQEESKTAACLIGNGRRKDDGNDTSVPPRKTHLKKKNKRTHNKPRCLSCSA